MAVCTECSVRSTDTDGALQVLQVQDGKGNASNYYETPQAYSMCAYYAGTRDGQASWAATCSVLCMYTSTGMYIGTCTDTACCSTAPAGAQPASQQRAARRTQSRRPGRWLIDTRCANYCRARYSVRVCECVCVCPFARPRGYGQAEVDGTSPWGWYLAGAVLGTLHGQHPGRGCSLLRPATALLLSVRSCISIARGKKKKTKISSRHTRTHTSPLTLSGQLAPARTCLLSLGRAFLFSPRSKVQETSNTPYMYVHRYNTYRAVEITSWCVSDENIS